MKVQIGPEIIRSYKRLSYTAWYALAEFIDNSIQSYSNNQSSLDTAYSNASQRLTVQISYSRTDEGQITIRDNGMGMSEEELTNALRIGRPPANRSGLSEFGMGLKTSACWFGNQWTVRTKRLGDSTGHAILFDVERVASGDLDLQHSQIASSEQEHFTEITITDLNLQMYGRTIEFVKTFLRSMYRTYITSTVLVLTFNGEQLTWESPIEDNVHVDGGSECFQEFAFPVNGKQVHGWIAVLERGSRASAGLTILRRGRVIKGWPSSWRPQSIYGQLEGSNDLVNQRLVGEINMDDFGVSHTKDDILWETDDMDLLETELARIAEGYIDIALSYRKRGARGSAPGGSAVSSAMGMLEEELHSEGFRSVISANGNTPRDRLEGAAYPMIRAMKATEPRGSYQLNGLNLNVFLSDGLSERDPYVGIEIGPDDTLSVVINMNHPHVKDIRGRMGVLNYFKACAYEGVAQWKVEKTWQTESPLVIRAIKDSLLRVGHAIDG